MINRLPALLCLSALLLALAGCGTENAIRSQTDLGEAQREAQIGQLAQARVWCDRAIAVSPHAVGTYLSLPTAGDPDALGIVSLYPEDQGVFSSVGDLPDSIAYLQKARAALPQDYRPLAALEQLYGDAGDAADQRATAAALAALLEQKIVRPGATHDEALMLTLSQAYFDAGNIAKGAADGQAVIRAFPTDPDVYNQLAYAWAVADSTPDLPQARTDAQKALALATRANEPDEGIAGIQDTLAWVQYRQADYADALANAQTAVSLDPREPEERYHLGMIYAALHQPVAARAELTHAADLEPGYAAAKAALAALPPAPPSSQ